MLNRETLVARQCGKSRKLFLDYLVEPVQGRTLTNDNLARKKTEIARHLLKHMTTR